MQLRHALNATGVDTGYHLSEGVTHEFFGPGTVIDKSREAVDQCATPVATPAG